MSRKCNTHSGIDVSSTAGVSTHNGWRTLDSKLKRGDTLVVAALDLVGRLALDVMGAIYDLVHRDIKLRSLADT